MRNHETGDSLLARDLRIGLMGSPFEWGQLQFVSSKLPKICFTFLSDPKTIEGYRQDILLEKSNDTDPVSDFGQICHNDFSVLEWNIPAEICGSLSPTILQTVFEQATRNLNSTIHEELKTHKANYVGTDSIISTYGTQVIRVCHLLDKPQIHIENEALAYLIETPWRNENELNYVISRMIFYLKGDVLHKPYVQNSVYEFGTSARGISNANWFTTLVEEFTGDVISKFDFRTAARLFNVHLKDFAAEPYRNSKSQPKKAA